MNIKLTRMTLALASLGMLPGCNDQLDIRVMDGYLNNAAVWLDVDGNFKQALDEPQAVTNEHGQATLDAAGLSQDQRSSMIIAQVKRGVTIDQDIADVTATRDYLLLAPADYSHVSPLTTYISLQTAQGVSEEKALKKLRKQLRQPDLIADSDYIANESLIVARAAKAMVQLLPDALSDDELKPLAKTLEKGAKELGKALKKGDDLQFKTLMLNQEGKPVVASDSDGDGVADALDLFPNDKLESADADLDGIGDHADLDDDNDGFTDQDELQVGTDPYDADSQPADLDGDKIPDQFDDDIDGDGWSNADEERLGSDAYNAQSQPADYDEDMIADVEDTDIDGDGAANEVDAFPKDRFESLDTNGDGLGDFASSDDDGDGIPDSIDPNPKSPDNSTTEPTPTYQQAVIYYKRDDGNYDGWGLHLWNNATCDAVSDDTLSGVDWSNPLSWSEIDPNMVPSLLSCLKRNTARA